MVPPLREKLRSLCASFKGGQVANHWHEWVKLTSDKQILSDIRGISIECTEFPTQHRLRGTSNYSGTETRLVDVEIQKLQTKEVVKVTRKGPGKLFPIFFSTPKKMGLTGSF